jgi:hypothetical protein
MVTGRYVRAQLEKLDFLVVQDMFLTETAALADVVFPVTSFAEAQGTQVNNWFRRLQFVRRSIPPVGAGAARLDDRQPACPPDGRSTSATRRQLKSVFRQIAENVEGYAGLSHSKLANEGDAAVPVSVAWTSTGSTAAELRGRLAGEVARINRQLPVDQSALTAKAGTRLASALHDDYTPLGDDQSDAAGDQRSRKDLRH